MINSRDSAVRVISQIMSNANGIGESKSRAKSQSDVIGQNHKSPQY